MSGGENRFTQIHTHYASTYIHNTYQPVHCSILYVTHVKDHSCHSHPIVQSSHISSSPKYTTSKFWVSGRWPTTSPSYQVREPSSSSNLCWMRVPINSLGLVRMLSIGGSSRAALINLLRLSNSFWNENCFLLLKIEKQICQSTLDIKISPWISTDLWELLFFGFIR